MRSGVKYRIKRLANSDKREVEPSSDIGGKGDRQNRQPDDQTEQTDESGQAGLVEVVQV